MTRSTHGLRAEELRRSISLVYFRNSRAAARWRGARLALAGRGLAGDGYAAARPIFIIFCQVISDMALMVCSRLSRGIGGEAAVSSSLHLRGCHLGCIDDGLTANYYHDDFRRLAMPQYSRHAFRYGDEKVMAK